MFKLNTRDYTPDELPQQSMKYACETRRLTSERVGRVPNDLPKEAFTQKLCKDYGCDKQQQIDCAKMVFEEAKSVRDKSFFKKVFNLFV